MHRLVSWFLRPFRRKQKVEFAATTRVLANPELHDEFIERVLGFGREDPVFISDWSSLADFGDDGYVAVLQQRVRDVYGVDVSDLKDGRICDILERIARTR